MKRSIIRVIAALLVLLLLAGCAPTPETPDETNTQADTAETAAPDTDAPGTDAPGTEPGTDPATEPDTPPETEPETDPPYVPQTPEEHRAEIERKTGIHTVGVGGFTTPADMNVTETAFRNLLDAGINFMVTGNECYGTVMLSNTLRVADETGMDLCLWVFGATVFTNEQVATKLKQVVGHPSVKSIYMMDEPQEPQFNVLKELKNRINKELGDYMDWKIGANMFPEATFPTVWYNMHEKYIKNVKPDYFCFDCYPWVGGQSGMDWFISNLGMAKKLTDKYGGELWCFLQTSHWDNADLPTDGKLRYQLNASLAMGCDSVIGFTTCDSRVDKYTNVLYPDGTPTEFYEVLKKVYNDMHGMKGVFLPFDCVGLMLRGEDAIESMTAEKADGVLIPDGAWESLASVDGDRFMIGCMKDADGHPGYYVVNSDYENAASFTLHFNGSRTIQLWNEKGLDYMGEGESITVDLVPGGGCFIITDRSLDATTYPEPEKAPEVVRPVVLDAKKDSLIFDLGFGEDGVAYNKVEDSLTTSVLSKGNYEVADGKPSLSRYSIYTSDMKGASENGVTVEMYLKFDENSNRRWITLFTDPNGNGNLHRMADAKDLEHADTIWQGSFSGNDAVLNGHPDNFMPVNEWLHVVSVNGPEGLYLYVNGELILESHFDFTPPAYSSFIFNDPKGDVDLNTARVYTYAATPEQVAQMYGAFSK